MRSIRTTCAGLLVLFATVAISACRSHGLDVTIQNNASTPIRNVELDYPGAAFGTPVIAPGKSYWYHIKPTSDGDVSLSFELENGKTFRDKGPVVHAGDSGNLVLIIEQDERQKWRMHTQTLTHR